jgi:outer membrane lipoprotein-sorting protein
MITALAFMLSAQAASFDAAAYLKRYDEVMSPAAFDADSSMVAHREDGSARTYRMRILKSGTDKLRSTFLEPAAAKGQEMLRNDENLWLYMPNLKRAVRVASRDSFMGGDFNNADVLRVNYVADYEATAGASADPALVLLELKAKSTQASYDAIKLWLTAGDPKQSQPVRAEYYAKSGKLLRSAVFLDVKDFGDGLKRPAKIEMKNAITPARHSEMVWHTVKMKGEIPAQRFVVDDLGR